MLTLEEGGYRVYENLLYCLCNFSVTINVKIIVIIK